MIKVLFFGDTVGKIGRALLEKYVPYLKKKYRADFVIVNGENVSHGKGLIEKHYQEILSMGVDAITLGNHYAGKKDIFNYLDNADKLVRPNNLLGDIGGKGYRDFICKGKTIRVINTLGTAFMNMEVSNPFFAISQELEDAEDKIVIVDFHAEATAEKISFGYIFDGKVSALVGTHTHVQTSDARILEGGTAYITDIGMVGSFNGVLGFEKDSVIQKTVFGSNERFKLLDKDDGIVSAIYMEFDKKTNKALRIEPIYIIDRMQNE